MALDKFKKLFIVDEEGMEFEENELAIEHNEKMEVVREMAKDDSQVVLMEPRAYSESQSIADHIKSDQSVIVNLHRVTPEQAKRIVDFLSGTVYALDGNIEKLGGKIFLLTPKKVKVAGAITELGEQ